MKDLVFRGKAREVMPFLQQQQTQQLEQACEQLRDSIATLCKTISPIGVLYDSYEKKVHIHLSDRKQFESIPAESMQLPVAITDGEYPVRAEKHFGGCVFFRLMHVSELSADNAASAS